MQIQQLNGDQRREVVNTRQRYAAYREAKARADSYRGSMVWSIVKGRPYLVRSAYTAGIRKQSSIGPQSPETERIKREYERGRDEAVQRLKEIKVVLARQAAINRAVGLGRVPLLGARIIRALDDTGILGSGIRVVGTHAIYAYEAAAGIQLDPGLTTTEDIGLLFDPRSGLTFAATKDVAEQSLLKVLRKVDRSFEKSAQMFRAVNRDGYLVDLIKPLRTPPWAKDRERIGADAEDVVAAEIEGLAWHESAPLFESVAIDERGEPLRIAASDPRIWAAHKLWLSKRVDRDPIRRKRDEAQARAIAQVLTEHLPHRGFIAEEMRMLPKNVFEDAKLLFNA